MEKNDYSEIEQLLKETYQQQEVAPQEDLWQRVASQMETQAPKRSPWKSLRTEVIIALASAVAVVTAVLVVFPPSAYRKGTEVVPQVVTTTSMPTDQQESGEALVSTHEVVSPVSTTQKQQPTKVTKSTQQQTSSSQLVGDPSAVYISRRQMASTPTVENNNAVSPSTSTVAVEHPIDNQESPSVAEVPSNSKAPTPVPPASQLRIPNVITPNGDGINDFFDIKGIEHLDDVYLKIVDRNGKKIYSTNHYKGGYAGEGAVDGTYFYTISSKSINLHRMGTLVIKRQ